MINQAEWAIHKSHANTYFLEGTALEVYQGAPCWYRAPGEPRGSVSIVTWFIDRGEIAGVKVSGTVLVTVTTKEAAAEGLKCRQSILVEEEAAPEILRWVLDAFQGRLGGSLAKLGGDPVGFHQVPINYRLTEGRCSVLVPNQLRVLSAGRSVSSSHPAGSAAPWRLGWMGERTQAEIRLPEHHMEFKLPSARAVMGTFRLAR